MAIYLPVQEGIPKIVVNLGTTLSLRRERRLDLARLSRTSAAVYNCTTCRVRNKTNPRNYARHDKALPPLLSRPDKFYTASAVVTGEKWEERRKARGKAFIRRVVIKKRFPVAGAVLYVEMSDKLDGMKGMHRIAEVWLIPDTRVGTDRFYVYIGIFERLRK
jgi:hypothetical protein